MLSDRVTTTSKWVLRHSTLRAKSEPGRSPNYLRSRKQNRLDDNMPSMGRRVDVSQLTEEECNKILTVISKDILIRKSERERISYLTKKFEDLRRTIILTNSSRKKSLPFDDYCLICGKHLFTFCCFFQRGEECISCEHACCPTCRRVLVVDGDDDSNEHYLCTLCIRKREAKGRASEWYYEAVDQRFKRFGSAKALRAIYKQRNSIEPRVITLLAMCRELQPTRKMSFASMKKRTSRTSISYSKDDDKISYTSSFSDLEPREFDRDRPRLWMNDLRRNHSESEVTATKENNTDNLLRTQSDASPLKKVNEQVSLSELKKSPKFNSYDIFKENVLRRKSTGINDAPVLKCTIIERDDESQDGSTKEGTTQFNEVDYLGLVSLTLTLCFVMALISCIGYVLEYTKESKTVEEPIE